MEPLYRDEVSAAFEPVGDQLAQVEVMLMEAGRAPSPFLEEVAGHLTSAGGKRIRPAVTLLASRLGNSSAPKAIMAAAAIEITHMATLYHDDVIDEGDLRRGVPSANAKWGNTVAILAGDFLFARSSSLAAEVGGRVPRILADAIASVVEGQLLQLEADFDVSRNLDHYLRTISGKTAALFEAAARIGALLGGLDPSAQGAVASFGRSFGMAFQVADDLLDLTASEEELGKPPGSDLREGVYNLPVIWAIENHPGLTDLLGSTDVDVDEVRKIILETGAFDRSRELASSHAQDALGYLATVEHGQPRDALENLARLVVERIPDPRTAGGAAKRA